MLTLGKQKCLCLPTCYATVVPPVDCQDYKNDLATGASNIDLFHQNGKGKFVALQSTVYYKVVCQPLVLNPDPPPKRKGGF